jgi:uncharacterized protein YpbB
MSIVSENEEKKFVSHTEIGMTVEGIVHSNALFDSHQHNRESLNNLITELIEYRDSLPSVEEYVKSGRLNNYHPFPKDIEK